MNQSERIYGLDILRGSAMVLGIFLHGAIAYKAGYPFGELIHDSDAEFFLFDWLHLLINSFRMQVFFLLAGFFAHLVIGRKGMKFFVTNRITRILIPLALAYFTILPATLIPVVYYDNLLQNPWGHVIDFVKDFWMFKKFSGLIHLWFLYDLIIFYILAITGKIVFNRFKFLSLIMGSLVNRVSWTGVVIICIILVGLISQLYSTPVLTIWTGFRPPIAQLLYYGFFFFLGWLLENYRQILAQGKNYFKPYLVWGLLLSMVNFYVLNFRFNQTDVSRISDITFRISLSIQTIFLVFGLMTLFYEKFKVRSDFGNYLAKSAYWVYLIHNPVVLTMQLLLLDSIIPGIFRFPLVIVVSTVFSYASYQYLVRKTWIGLLLNGK